MLLNFGDRMNTYDTTPYSAISVLCVTLISDSKSLVIYVIIRGIPNIININYSQIASDEMKLVAKHKSGSK